jgi:hypothetical protein
MFLEIYASKSPHASIPKHRAVLGQLSDMDLRLLQVFKAAWWSAAAWRRPSWS